MLEIPEIEMRLLAFGYLTEPKLLILPTQSLLLRQNLGLNGLRAAVCPADNTEDALDTHTDSK